MGCSNNEVSEGEENNYKAIANSSEKIQKMLKSYKEGILKYKKYKEQYEDILEQQIKCEKLLKKYFSMKSNIVMSNEPNEIKSYKKIFNKINKVEEDLKIVPGFLTKYSNKNKKETEVKNEEDINDENEEESENEDKRIKKKNKEKYKIKK